MPNEKDEEGVWIGVDLGTSNSACAVWDSNRGSPKWIRLKDIAPPEGSGKDGRLVPSVVRVQANSPLAVGAEALGLSSGTPISSVKRLLGQKKAQLELKWIESLPYNISEDNSGELVISAELENGQIVTLKPEDILAAIFKALRKSSQLYLDKYRTKKKLETPGVGVVRHAVVGVPAHYSKRQITLVEEACRTAGFDGHVSTFLESTAAAMAYGLSIQELSRNPTIMVIDIGGGTTDVTIATNESRQSQEDPFAHRVLVTEGDGYLGGDDIDLAIMTFCLSKVKNSDSKEDLTSLRNDCRKAKELLCDSETPRKSEEVCFNGCKIIISQETFEQLLEKWLLKLVHLIKNSLQALEQANTMSGDACAEVSEVILVGGTSRIPAVRRAIQGLFPAVELCTSLNPMSSVAQGLAIRAALKSNLVPVHQLKSAMMLDCIPHAIGVGAADGGFIEILPKNATLPAKGSAPFVLADKFQRGVTIKAVERIGETQYEQISNEDFTFLLRRLSTGEYDSMTQRIIEVGMKVDHDGKFIVSIFDENDPEQVRKKERYAKVDPEAVGELGYIKDLILSEANVSGENFFLVFALIAVVILYMALKILFNDPVMDKMD